MAVDIVYKVGNKCHWDDYEELRYSLRSFQQNFKDLGKVYIVGKLPSWCTNVIHIQANDPYKRNKDGNLINKLLLACYDINLSDEFISTCDDHFVLKPIDRKFFEIPVIDNAHINFIPGAVISKWQTRLKRTVDILKERNLRFDCYEGHIPYMFNKHKFPKILLSYDYGVDLGYCGNTLYFNTLPSAYQSVGKHILCRLIKRYTYEQIKEFAVNSMFLNATEDAVDQGYKLFLSKTFTSKSRYEV